MRVGKGGLPMAETPQEGARAELDHDVIARGIDALAQKAYAAPSLHAECRAEARKIIDRYCAALDRELEHHRWAIMKVEEDRKELRDQLMNWHMSQSHIGQPIYHAALERLTPGPLTLSPRGYRQPA